MIKITVGDDYEYHVPEEHVQGRSVSGYYVNDNSGGEVGVVFVQSLHGISVAVATLVMSREVAEALAKHLLERPDAEVEGAN
jgi:hypothetical protein